jgi:hypothetical protein
LNAQTHTHGATYNPCALIAEIAKLAKKGGRSNLKNKTAKAMVKAAVIMMVKDDDSDIVIKALEHWRSIGVGAFFICETSKHNSLASLLQDFARANGVILHYRHNPVNTFDGHRIVNMLKQNAIDEGYSCLFPADADEFLNLGTYSNVQEWIGKYPSLNYWWCEVPYLNHWPGGGSTWQEPQGKAILINAHPSMDISIGNHLVTNTGDWDKASVPGLHYDHYPFRTKEQMVRKITSHGTAFMNMGMHDAHYAALYRAMQSGGQAWIDAHWKELCGRGIDKEIQAPKWL